jgi:hypothetical protein
MIGFLILGGECLFRLSETDSSGDTLFNYFFFDERYRRRGLIEDGGIFARGYEIRVNNRGFREAKEWPPNDKKDQLRVIIGAAGHGYGENLTDGLIYPHLLETSLNDQSNRSVEVFNLSVQGSTILFLERALLTEIIAADPDVVILSYAGFNEALYTYLPESTVLFPNNIVYNLLMSSALVRHTRIWMGSFQKRSHRMTPAEMIESYHKIISELRVNGITVLILNQLVIHPDIDGLWSLSEMEHYRTALQDFALEQSLPFLDPLPFCPIIERCFKQKEWYSAKGHRAAFSALQEHTNLILGVD